MNLCQMFPSISPLKFKKLSSQHNIIIPPDYQFSDINIVIGPNGAGKTRFLNLIKEFYQESNNASIMYGYFPGLSDKKHFNKSNEETDYTLFDTLSIPQTTFEDFLSAIESYSDDFILDILQYLNHRGRVQKNRSQKALNSIVDCFFELSEKKIDVTNDGIIVTSSTGRKEPLEESLKMFSPGELMLFYMSIFLALQDNHCDNKVIILDEPECHLHPQALLTFINYLRKRKDHSTIWIATHSLFLIPEFDFENIVYLNQNIVVPRNSNLYSSLVSDLLGSHYDKVSDFFSSLSQWQFCSYISECFSNPQVIEDINPQDEQVQLFINYLNNNSVYNILDFGGGSARLGLSLKYSLGNNFSKHKYSIYDPKPTYSGDEFAVYKNTSEIDKKFDCIVMMNVLHEIPPKDWTNIFSDIYNLMTDNAFLIFVETSILSKGELPNKTGFLVLGEEELCVLFTEKKLFPSLKIKDNQKSLCTIIPKSSLSKITSQSVSNAIKLLEDNSLKTLKSLKASRNNKKSARKYAFYSQLYINAKLYNDTTKENKANRKNKVDITTSIQNEKESLLSCLAAIQNLKDKQNTSISSIVMESINVSIQLLHLLENGVFIPPTITDLLWKNVLDLEQLQAQKRIISTFLRINSLAKHKKSTDRLKNQYL